jgi:hypothetical protein
VCGKPFTKNSTAIYCSTACQQKAKRNRLKSHLDAEIELKFNDGGGILDPKTQKNTINKDDLLTLFSSWDKEFVNKLGEEERNARKKSTLSEEEEYKQNTELGIKAMALMDYAKFIRERIANY